MVELVSAAERLMEARRGLQAELSDLPLYVIDVSAGEKIPRKGGPGITKSDLLIINKIDLAPMVGVSLELMDCDAKKFAASVRFCSAT